MSEQTTTEASTQSSLSPTTETSHEIGREWECPRCDTPVEGEVFDGGEVRCPGCNATLMALVEEEGGPAWFYEPEREPAPEGETWRIRPPATFDRYLVILGPSPGVEIGVPYGRGTEDNELQRLFAGRLCEVLNEHWS